MMRRWLFGLAAALPLLPAPALANDAIFGHWLTDDRSAVIRIDACGSRLCGRIARVLDPKAPASDINNPNARLRGKPLVGTAVLSGFAQAGAGWTGGQAYDPKSGKSYRSQLQLLGNGTLKVTGCILFLCRSRIWTRAK